MNRPPIVAVCGAKNAGKTTFIAGLLPRLAARGLRVAVIKHDGHDFEPDVPGTDSYRLRQAGAGAVAVFSPHRYLLTEARKGLEVADIAAFFPGYDLILLEGGKHSAYPKLEVFRPQAGAAPVSNGVNLLAIVGGAAPGCTAPQIGPDDFEAACGLILKHLGGAGKTPRPADENSV